MSKPPALHVDRLKARIRELRTERHWSQADLAGELGTKRQHIGDWETGRWEPNALYLIRMADLFGVSLDYLVGRSDVKSP